MRPCGAGTVKLRSFLATYNRPTTKALCIRNEMKYLLKYKEVEVGEVILQEEDFLNMWGSFRINDSLDNEDILNLVSLSKRESDLIEEDHLRDIDEELSIVSDNMELYTYLIDSEDWVLINNEGDTLPILVPSFKSDDSLVWRWQVNA